MLHMYVVMRTLAVPEFCNSYDNSHPKAKCDVNSRFTEHVQNKPSTKATFECIMAKQICIRSTLLLRACKSLIDAYLSIQVEIRRSAQMGELIVDGGSEVISDTAPGSFTQLNIYSGLLFLGGVPSILELALIWPGQEVRR